MVPPAQHASLPLLPWERQLIDALGISDEEYKEAVRQIAYKSQARPAAYEHVPEINNELVSIITSIVIGAALSAVSYALTPKPKAPQLGQNNQSGQDSGSSLALSGFVGRQRYASVYGFDSAQDLASYGQTVPIAFTARNTTVNSGGLLLSPLLVWSRITSWGTFQVAQMVFIAGQGPMQRPDLAGVFIGNNAFGSVDQGSFQFYWAGGFSSDSRLRGQALRSGTLSTPPIPGSTAEAFTAPTRSGNADAAFSGAFSPQNQTVFGVYNGIPNGTPFRPDWEIISVLKDSPSSSQQQAITNQGKYIDEAQASTHPFGGFRGPITDAGMPGTGRNYSSHIGIVAHNGYSMSNPPDSRTALGYRTVTGAVTEERTVNVGDTIVIQISGARQSISPIPKNGPNDNPVELTDVRSATESALEQYDDMLQVGATFMIGRSTWEVISRPDDVYESTSPTTINITLRCTETWSRANNKIGLVAPRILDEQNWIPFPADVSEVWYPILKYNIGQIRNNRSCDCTEIGIKAQVWARFNGITNFNTVPNPLTMAGLNYRNVSVREGKNQSYGPRTAFFALDIRPADNESLRGTLPNDGWEATPHFFAVTGSTPQDIYSFIRVKHPQREQYEFRLRPLPSTVLALQGAQRVFQLNGITPYQEWPWNSTMGTFMIGARGRFIEATDLPRLYTHSQMVAKPDQLGTLSFGTTVDTGEPLTLALNGVFSNISNAAADWKKISNILTVQVGEDPFVTQRPAGYRRTFENWVYSRNGFYLRMRITIEAFDQAGTGIAASTGRNKWWRLIQSVPIESQGFWSAGMTFAKNAADAAGEQWRFEYTVLTTRQEYTPFPTPVANTRVWEQYTAISEVSHYGDLITRSCDSGPEFECVYINESLAENNGAPLYQNCAVTGLKLKSSNTFPSLDQLRVYVRNGIEVELLNGAPGTRGPSNLLTDLLWYLVTNTDTGVGNIVDSSLIDRAQLVRTGTYLQANQLYFDDVITGSINIRSWLADKAPSMLCYVAIRNGQLSLNPALPQNAGGTISTTTAVPISALFTDGNIIEDSFTLEWLESEERQMFQASITYNQSRVNQFPEQRTIVVRYNQAGSADLPVEEFDLPHITHARHAELAARYFLAVRRHVTHAVTFKTLPYGLSLAPGDWIRVAVEMSPYSPANNGVIRPDGTIICANAIADGNYTIWSWARGQTTVRPEQMTVVSGRVQQANLFNSLFSIRVNQNALQVYQVEAIELDNEGIVTIKASNFPVDGSGISLIAQDLLDSTAFITI